MDRRAKDEVLETLKIHGVESSDRESCLQDITEAFNSYRLRSRALTKKRRKIEAGIRAEDVRSHVKCVGSEDDYVILHSNGEWVDSLIAASPAQARAFMKAHRDKVLGSVDAWKKLLFDFSPA